MTVLVGMLCDGGVIIGSDSSATFAAGQTRTIEQPTKKLTIIDGQMIVASTGSGGFGQRFVGVVEKLRTNRKLTGSPLDIGRVISQTTLNDFRSTLPTVDHLIANSALDFGGLVAGIHKSKPYLIEFDSSRFQPELKDDRLWYVSMGSGQPIADPFLGLLRKCFFEHGPPGLATGRFAVSWALKHTCEVNPGGVKEPFHIAVLETKTSAAKELTDDELQEHHEMVAQAYKYLSNFPKELFSAESPSIPE